MSERQLGRHLRREERAREKGIGRRRRRQLDWLWKVDVADMLERLEIEHINQATADEVNYSCPLEGHTHGDETPSAYINDGTKERDKATLWKCHGCGKSGNAVHLVAEVEGISYQEALQQLRAEYAPDWRSPKGGTMRAEFERHLLSTRREVHVPVPLIGTWDWYEEQFGIPWPLGASASDFPDTPMAYMYERGFDSKTLNHWRIGYDEISDRVAIPVSNVEDQLIGIKGRAWRKDKKPKYKVLGNAEGKEDRYSFPAYEKSRVVFGLNRCVNHKGRVVLDEGEINCIAWDIIGERAISTGSAALSEEQSILIRDYCDEIIVFFDDNTAGNNATFGYYNSDGEWVPGIVERMEPFVRLFVAPKHERDAADHIRDGDGATLLELLAEAVPSHRL